MWLALDGDASLVVGVITVRVVTDMYISQTPNAYISQTFKVYMMDSNTDTPTSENQAATWGSTLTACLSNFLAP
jgi:hypothetical protein